MSLKILLADDSVTAQNMGKKILSDAGFEVVAVSNGSAALKKIPEIKPDLVILDVYMPGYSGLEVCQKIKDAKQTVSLPVLLTVGKLEPFKARDASRVGADGFIVKPFEASELLATIKRIVGVLPEGAGKKNGQDSKARVKEAKLASQAASAEQLASALKNVLPSESRFDREQEQEYEEPPHGRPIDAQPASTDEESPRARDAEPFSVSGAPESADEETYSEREPDSTKFHVDFEKRERPPERHDDNIPFRASSFEVWEKANAPTPAEIASREVALARIRAARQSEAEESQETDVDPDATVIIRRPPQLDANATQPPRPGSDLDPDATLSLDNTTWQAISDAGRPTAPESMGTTASAAEEQSGTATESAPIPQPVPVSSPSEESPAPQVSAEQPRGPISGLADWASDLHDTTAAAPAAAGPIADKWIAEEVPLASGDSALSLAEEMHRFQARDGQPSEPEPQHDEISQEPPVEIAAVPTAETPEPEPVEAISQPAPDAATEEQVAALAKAAAAAAISSISEIREAVLASAAAAGASAGISESVTIQSQSHETSSAEVAPDMAQFATHPSASTEDIQGATIAAVTREVAEVAETASADLNSDAIASIVNRVIEQMKPKLVAEIAKELTHKPKNE